MANAPNSKAWMMRALQTLRRWTAFAPHLEDARTLIAFSFSEVFITSWSIYSPKERLEERKIPRNRTLLDQGILSPLKQTEKFTGEIRVEKLIALHLRGAIFKCHSLHQVSSLETEASILFFAVGTVGASTKTNMSSA
ncbi:hypothetical protein AVEN_170857-1 [Araneus ventricosus]|uniref:Uncharacterized protein n=1 Tax=Araneus ventricosus TaxID=182803 RepID=A0A4Y2ULA9_ARAVE|nr:hypothetical protein AVEN_170857-1 [Araneus ventricosus]